MPTVLRVGAYRFFFYSSDGIEPMHVHIEKDDMIAKFWLVPVRLQVSGGFSRQEVAKLQRMVEENKMKLIEAWNDYFND
ncbi:MAG: DUF4160 domain-containing protein [Desulfobulbaceae bacterium]|nr:DUF4160 domain-containing protein [Desulfobulbaceae bacterium]